MKVRDEHNVLLLLKSGENQSRIFFIFLYVYYQPISLLVTEVAWDRVVVVIAVRHTI